MENPDTDDELPKAQRALEAARHTHSEHEGGGSPITQEILDDCIERCRRLSNMQDGVTDTSTMHPAS